MFARAWEVFAENKLALIGLGFVIFIFAFCFIGPHIYVTNQVDTNLDNALCTPGPRTCSAARSSATTSSAG